MTPNQATENTKSTGDRTHTTGPASNPVLEGVVLGPDESARRAGRPPAQTADTHKTRAGSGTTPETVGPLTDPEATSDSGPMHVLDAIAGVVLATPGVIRFEPSVRGSVVHALRRGVVAAASLRPEHSGERVAGRSGLYPELNGQELSVRIEIAADLRYPATATADAVRARVREQIRRANLRPGKVDVAVLAMDTSD
ncbi:hypothetical protein [Devriesea agamarum]|uniref:hypothetical protein n=1 Tax=Devriesea agamarum TaxID=472569 RepID=UPI00071DD177|nr:hypothetical protein [Devriesea agamarum]